MKQKEFFIAANILGTVTVRAKSIEDAKIKAERMMARQFVIKPKPAGIMVFDTENMPKEDIADAGVSTGA
jgi:hypothetical protein